MNFAQRLALCTYTNLWGLMSSLPCVPCVLLLLLLQVS
jgi:hypothetical protein